MAESTFSNLATQMLYKCKATTKCEPNVYNHGTTIRNLSTLQWNYFENERRAVDFMYTFDNLYVPVRDIYM